MDAARVDGYDLYENVLHYYDDAHVQYYLHVSFDDDEIHDDYYDEKSLAER